jgi:hypothetical protein
MKYIRILLIFSSLLLIFCGKDESKVDKKKDIQREQSRYTSIKFTEDLRINREDWYPGALEIDDEGKIYVFDNYLSKIYIFDIHGNEVDQKEFRQGQGPGDINFMDPAFSSKGNLHIYDKKIRRLTIFDKDWNILDTRSLEQSHFIFLLDSNNCMYLWKAESEFIEGEEKVNNSLVKLSSSGKFLNEFLKYEGNANQIRSNIFAIYIYPPYGIFKLDTEDFIYYATSDKYEINVVSPQGKLIRKITKTTKTRNVTEMDTGTSISNYKKALARFEYKLEFVIPDRMPAIADFFVFENKYILIVTYENPMDSPALSGDLFDNKGTFLSNVDVPKYSRWDDWRILFKKGAIYKNNHFYTIEKRDDDSFIVKRYKVSWII